MTASLDKMIKTAIKPVKVADYKRMVEKAKPRKPQRHIEANEQAIVVAWARSQYRAHPDIYPCLRLLHCSLNGVPLSQCQAGTAKAQGMLKGVPDLLLPVPRNGYHGLFIEMKAKDGRVTPEQDRFIREVNDLGYLGVVCHGHQAAIDVIKGYYGVCVISGMTAERSAELSRAMAASLRDPKIAKGKFVKA